jgi:hypothetical protein
MARIENRTSRQSAGRAGDTDAEAPPERSAVRLVAAGVREKGELAFTARMAPITVESPARPTARTAEPFAVAGRSALPEAVASKPAPLRDNTPAPPEASPSTARQGPRAEAAHEQEEPPPAQPDRQPGTGVPLRSQVPVTEATSVASRRAEAAESPQAAPGAALDAEPAPTKPSSPAREIRLELATGEERVEVKLSEKAGEIKVAVRTVDSHLAERLRGDLPALASRLEQRGLRTETWQPSQTGGGDWRRPDETAATNSGGTQEDASRQQGREQQREGEPRRPHMPKEEEQQLKDKRKDFEWFLSATQ